LENKTRNEADLMDTNPHIRYLKRQEIDIARWDHCVAQARNTLIYGFHYYLDQMTTGQWEGLVLDDYLAVMPLTWRRKFGIRYLYQPAFMQQTGVFSEATITPALVEAFLNEAARHYRFSEIFLNYDNILTSLRQHVNYILPLDAAYEQLADNYKKDLIRNLKRAAHLELQYHRDDPPFVALTSFREEYKNKIASLARVDYDRFERLCAVLQDRGQLIVRSVRGKTGDLLATALILRDRKRLYLLHSTTLPAGRDTEANHFLLDQFIREFAASELTLDFEGSDLAGIAHFYKNFGSIDQPYYFYCHDRLPCLVRLFKTLFDSRL
jgi:Acetyltransferase (GNAT) domain